jgi:hypothetical protein
MRRGTLPLTAGAVLAAMAAAHCGSEEPTQIIVHVDSTPEECSQIQKTIVRIGSFEDFDSPAAGEKAGCDPATNRIGTFVLVPKASHDAEVRFQVVTGVAKNADECRPENRVDCIFAKRSLHFVPRQTLEVTVLMAGACRGKTCHADETCDETGECVLPGGGRVDAGAGDAGATPRSRCEASGCSKLEGAACREDGVCEVNCGKDQECSLTCPPGISCVFKCERSNACRSIKCDASNPSCDIQCFSSGACRNVSCGSDTCRLKCDRRQSSSGRACATVNISSKNATTIDCEQCGCGELTCSSPTCTCTPSGPQSCSSSIEGACAGCSNRPQNCSVEDDD